MKTQVMRMVYFVTLMLLLNSCVSTVPPPSEESSLTVTSEPVVNMAAAPADTPPVEPTSTPVVPTSTPRPTTAPATDTPTPRLSVSGLILDQVTGQPVTGAEVSAGITTATTGSNGRYTLANLTPGQYVVSVVHQDYDPALSPILFLGPGRLMPNLELYPIDETPYPEDPMLTNPIDPNGAPTKEEAERLAREQGLSADVTSIEETTLSGIPSEGRILEIGCGPGKATVLFARCGYSMLCLELGESLAAVARENCRPYPRVEIQTTAFEAWDRQAQRFDLVISAQAFHWIPPEIGYSKVHQALKQSGTMALFWNQRPDPQTPFFQALDEVYRTKVPHLAEKKRPWEVWVRQTEAEINETGLFRPVEVRQYPWQQQYTAEQYIKLLNTYSDHLSLPNEKRQDLFEAVRELIEQYGGIVTRPYVTVLYLVQAKA